MDNAMKEPRIVRMKIMTEQDFKQWSQCLHQWEMRVKESEWSTKSFYAETRQKMLIIRVT